jgi:hypothetical protein
MNLTLAWWCQADRSQNSPFPSTVIYQVILWVWIQFEYNTKSDFLSNIIQWVKFNYWHVSMKHVNCQYLLYKTESMCARACMRATFINRSKPNLAWQFSILLRRLTLVNLSITTVGQRLCGHNPLPADQHLYEGRISRPLRTKFEIIVCNTIWRTYGCQCFNNITWAAARWSKLLTYFLAN